MAEITHAHAVAFAANKVNLPGDRAQKHRDQVNSLRERMKKKIDADEDYGLVKSLHAGSVAKGTALRTVNDLDLAVYVKAAAAPDDDPGLVSWLADRLYEANPNMERDQFQEEAHCVTVNFRGTGLDVDVVPVLYDGESDDRGYLVNKNSGDRMLTSIPLHLKFIRQRKQSYGASFAELIRMTKWWKLQVGKKDAEFRFKSFGIELVWSHLADNGLNLSDYPTALEAFFEYIVKTEFDSQIAFTDFCEPHELPSRGTHPIQIVDPVNPDNNVCVRYDEAMKARIVSAAQDAFDALSEARWANTKGRAVECWQRILGPGFTG